MVSVVLIDTWWNVNSNKIPDGSDLGKSFNRYMVECESVSVATSVVTSVVLIDTWWNVNLHFVQIVGCGGSF